MDFDNVGLLVGDEKQAVDRALVALDITPAVVEEASACGAQLIVSHHPVIFTPLRRLTAAVPLFCWLKKEFPPFVHTPIWTWRQAE